MTQHESLSFRASIKVSRALNPALYDTLATLPKSDRSDFVLQVLKDWSRGQITDTPTLPGHPTIERNTGAAEKFTAGGNVADVPAVVQRPPKQALNGTDTKAGLHQSSRGNRIDVPTSELASQVNNDGRATRTLEDLGIRSQSDWDDAFNYSTP